MRAVRGGGQLSRRGDRRRGAHHQLESVERRLELVLGRLVEAGEHPVAHHLVEDDVQDQQIGPRLGHLFQGLAAIAEGETTIGAQQLLQMFVVAVMLTAGLLVGNTIVRPRTTL